MKIVSLLRISGLFTLLLLGIVTHTQAQSTTQNYVRTRVPRTPIKTTGRLDTLTTNKDSVQSTIQYLDGLGRPIQTVQVYGSPNGQDLVQPQAYDQFGREPIKYQPYSVTPTTAGMYQGTALSGTGGYTGSQQYSFYQITGQSFANTTSPYAVTVFELSPLQRPVEQGAPGNAWQPYSGSITGSGHTVKMAYANNNTTALSDTSGTRIVALYTAAINSNGSRALNRAGSNTAVYGANQLSVTISKDENWQSGRAGTVEEYKDKAGRVVLKRTFNYKSGTLEILSTYYVYDDKGLLAYVLPPGAAPDATGAISSTTLSNYCYQYRYDGRGRLTEKKLPGKGWDFVVYNSLDQVVATQDSMQRANGQWIITKYDALGRTVLTGIMSSGSSRGSLQSTLDGQTTLWEARTNDIGTGYTANAWPASWGAELSINYYDDYAYVQHTYDSWLSGTMPRPRGMPAATLTGVLNPAGDKEAQLITEYFYDDQGRVAQTSKQHYLGGLSGYSRGNYDVNIPTYNFNDQVIANSRYHVLNYTVPLTVINYYGYDHMGRPTDTYDQVLSGTTLNTQTLTSRKQYDLLGQLKTKYLHSTDYGSNFLQSLSYNYNPRGWLTTANSSGNLFNEELQYESPSTGKQYNGNISKMLYSGTYSGSKSFTYGYDKLNRLVTATSTGNTLDEGLTYDVMGNITNLTRGGQSYSSLTYGYSGNQLTGVSGTSFTTRSYAYDGNGNATSDGGSKTIDYNLLNLPRKVRNGSTELANYTYDATGNKLSNVSTASGMNDGTWEYIDGIVYHNGSVAFISTEEGRAVPNGGGNYVYQYNLKDHLGNDRVSFYSNSGTATVLQEDEYYSFGLRHGLYDASTNNRYLYNGKEIQTDLANQYDYGARFYDPVIGRWTSVDPLAEKGRRWASYNYGFDNPIRFEDPDGMWPGEGFLGDFWSHAQSSFKGYYTSAISTAKSIYHKATDPKASFTLKDVGNAALAMQPLMHTYHAIKTEVTAIKAIANGDGKTLGNIAGNQAANTLTVLATDGAMRVAANGMNSLTNQMLTNVVKDLGGYMEANGQRPGGIGGAVLNGKTNIAISGPVQDVMAPQYSDAANSLGGWGAKNANAVATVGACCEVQASNPLLLDDLWAKVSDVLTTPVIRPKGGDIVPMCNNCKVLLEKK